MHISITFCMLICVAWRLAVGHWILGEISFCREWSFSFLQYQCHMQVIIKLSLSVLFLILQNNSYWWLLDEILLALFFDKLNTIRICTLNLVSQTLPLYHFLNLFFCNYKYVKIEFLERNSKCVSSEMETLSRQVQG